MKKIICYAALLLLTACQPTIDHRGYHFNDEKIKKIKPLKTNQETVVDVLGNPSLKATTLFKGEKLEGWYYIGKKVETVSFFKPTTTEQKALRIIFNKKNIVIDILYNDHVEEKDIAFDTDQTATTSYEESLGGSILGTIDRMFKTAKKKKVDA